MKNNNTKIPIRNRICYMNIQRKPKIKDSRDKKQKERHRNFYRENIEN